MVRTPSWLRLIMGRSPARAQISSHHSSPAPKSPLAQISSHHSSPAPKSPLDDEDLLQEILLRLPPKPSSLPRASLVCTRWRNILSDPRFLSRFRKHHQKPPLLGFFVGDVHAMPVFVPILNSPDHIPAARFSAPQSQNRHDEWRFMGCRHGLALLLEVSRREAVVWDPLTGQQHHVNFPPGMYTNEWNRWHASVMCADTADGHVHGGDCFSSPFKLVLILVVQRARAFACLYESASGVWGDIASTATTYTICYTKPSVLIGNALCWLLGGGDVLAFDFERQSLDVIEKPDMKYYYGSIRLFRTEDNGPALACLSEQELTIQLWERKPTCDGAVQWVLLQKIIQLKGLFPRRMPSYDKRVHIMGYDEDTNEMVLSTATGNFMLQLDSVQIRHIIKRDYICHNTIYPYRNFYTAGNTQLSTLPEKKSSN